MKVIRQAAVGLLELGIGPDASAMVYRQYTTTNANAWLTIFATISAAMAVTFTSNPITAIPLLSVAAITAPTVAMSALNRVDIGRSWLGLAQVVGMLILAVYMGTEVTTAVPFIVVLYPFLVFDTQERQRWPVLAVCAAGSALVLIPGLLPGPLWTLEPTVTRSVELVITAAVFSQSFVFIAFTTAAHSASRLRLAEQQQRAEMAEQAKDQFLANMSHELRTPLGAIIGWTEVLASPATPERQRVDALNTIERNSRALIQLVDQILDLSKIQAGELLIEPMPTSVVSVVEDVASLMRVRATGKMIALNVRYSGKLPTLINTDPTRLRQILINLVGNAVKFTEAGGEIVIDTRVDQESAPPRLIVEVRDTGVGIDEENISDLFEPFVQQDSSVSRRFGGTGLGLPISRRLAQLLGGDLTARRGAETGSAFTVRLPLTQGESSNVASPLIEPAHPTDKLPTPLTGLRVLVAEDFTDNATLIRIHLEARGAQVDHAENGEEAIVLATGDRPFDVILMDMQMPVKDGYQATRELRNRGFTKPVIALTAHAMMGDRRRCISAGCDGYQSKPVNFEALAQEILRTIEAQRLPTQDKSNAPEPAADLHPEQVLALQMRELKAQYLDRLVGIAEQLRAFASSEDANGIQDIAHKLAGSAGMFGLDGLGTAARELEQAIIGGGAWSDELAVLLTAADDLGRARASTMP